MGGAGKRGEQSGTGIKKSDFDHSDSVTASEQQMCVLGEHGTGVVQEVD